MGDFSFFYLPFQQPVLVLLYSMKANHFTTEALIQSARELGERIFVRKRCKTAGILCVFQGFTNAFLAEIIRQDPKTHLISASLGNL